MALLSLTSQVVSNDSGLMHVAAALGRPVVAVYGSTSPGFTPPFGRESENCADGDQLQPCFERQCPLGHYKCLRDLAPETVNDAFAVVAVGALMKVLLIKTSSLGDIIHTLPALPMHTVRIQTFILTGLQKKVC